MLECWNAGMPGMPGMPECLECQIAQLPDCQIALECWNAGMHAKLYARLGIMLYSTVCSGNTAILSASA